MRTLITQSQPNAFGSRYDACRDVWLVKALAVLGMAVVGSPAFDNAAVRVDTMT